MSRPSIAEKYSFMTLSDVKKKLVISRKAIKNRIEEGIFLPPSRTTEAGARLFSERWLQHAQVHWMFEKKLISADQRDASLLEMGFEPPRKLFETPPTEVAIKNGESDHQDIGDEDPPESPSDHLRGLGSGEDAELEKLAEAARGERGASGADQPQGK